MKNILGITLIVAACALVSSYLLIAIPAGILGGYLVISK